MRWPFSGRSKEEQTSAEDFNAQQESARFNNNYENSFKIILDSGSDDAELIDAMRLIGQYARSGGQPMPRGFNYHGFNNHDLLKSVADRLLQITITNAGEQISDVSLTALRSIRRTYDALGPSEYMEYMSSDFDPRVNQPKVDNPVADDRSKRFEQDTLSSDTGDSNVSDIEKFYSSPQPSDWYKYSEKKDEKK